MDKKEEFVGMLKENQKEPTVKQEGNKLPQYVCAIVGKYTYRGDLLSKFLHPLIKQV